MCDFLSKNKKCAGKKSDIFFIGIIEAEWRVFVFSFEKVISFLQKTRYDRKRAEHMFDSVRNTSRAEGDVFMDEKNEFMTANETAEQKADSMMHDAGNPSEGAAKDNEDNGFAWLDEDYDGGESGESVFDDVPIGIPKPTSGEEVLSEIEMGNFSAGIIVNVGDEAISEKAYTDITVDFRKQNDLFQVDFHGSDVDLQSIWQQLEMYGKALETYTSTADSTTVVTCAIIFIPSKYLSTVTFEVDMPLIWAISATKIGYPADTIRLVAPTDYIGVYETGFDAEHEIQNIAEDEARQAAAEDAEKRRQNIEAYREIYGEETK